MGYSYEHMKTPSIKRFPVTRIHYIRVESKHGEEKHINLKEEEGMRGKQQNWRGELTLSV